ncbi:hypothetical protein EON81_18520 [bacterium]|nr:MAG: hypothetical protein EON81_18520 [bacterium]
MKRTLLLLALCLATQASAEPAFLETFKKTYALKSGTKLADSQCNLCHAGPPKRNVYGRALSEAMVGGKVTAAVLHSIDARDSDGDGATNADEIAAGTLPGDPTSFPPKTVAPPAGNAPQSEPTDVVPKHSGHPLIIHFPIALFLFGAFLDRLGVRQGDEGLRRGALLTMSGGSMTSLLAVATGVVAALRLGYSLTPGEPVFTHLILGIMATLAMLGATAQRKRSANSVATLVTIVLAAVLVMAAGHFGGALVYDR